MTMSKFIELTTGKKPILVNADHVIYVIPVDFGDKQMTELRVNQYQDSHRRLSSSAPVFEIIGHNYVTITVDQDYATVSDLFLANPQNQSL